VLRAYITFGTTDSARIREAEPQADADRPGAR
jgi:hypothetical protein